MGAVDRAGGFRSGDRRGPVFLFSPTAANDVWAWKLTPLTAGVVGSFTIQVGVGALLLSLDERWSAWRLLLETFLAATA